MRRNSHSAGFCAVPFFLVTFLLAATASAQETFFYEDFSDNTAGWVLDTQWQIGPALASTGHSHGFADPALDFTPTSDNGVAGTVIGGNVTTAVHPYHYLTSPVVNTQGEPTVILSFQRWLNSDYTPFMNNTVEVYNGSAWQMIFQSGPTPGVTDAAWSYQQFDISEYANATMRVRFGHTVGSTGAFTVSGWNIDEVYFVGEVPEPAGAALALGGAALLLRRRRQT